MKLLGIILSAMLVIIGLRADTSRLIDVPSILIVLALMAGGLMTSFGPRRTRIFRILFGKGIGREDLLYGLAVCARARSYALAGGVLGTLIGTMIMWNHIDDPTALGPGIAIALLTQLYPILLAYAILLPFSLSLRQSLEELEAPEE